MADNSNAIVFEQMLNTFYNNSVNLGLSERQNRIIAAKFAISYGHGGIVKVAKASGLSRKTIEKGVHELKGDTSSQVPEGRSRRSGGGRKNEKEKHPGLADALQRILDGNTYGDPTRILFHTSVSTYKAAAILSSEYGIDVSEDTVSRLMEELGYSRQLNQKTMQLGKQHPDRNTQFEFINRQANMFLDGGIPVISVDCKKKENIGNFKNTGGEYRPVKNPRKVLDHDFTLPELGKVAPYGIYSLNDNTGFVNLGTSKETAEFAVQSIRLWWKHVGEERFPKAKQIYITCDGGGSNGSRVRLWKYELARFSEETGLSVYVSHFPPGTSKWNKIEHRLFCYITKNWSGKPLIDIETVVRLIGSTTTKTGFKVSCQVDERNYETAIKVSDEDFARIDMESSTTCDSWNYCIKGFKW